MQRSLARGKKSGWAAPAQGFGCALVIALCHCTAGQGPGRPAAASPKLLVAAVVAEPPHAIFIGPGSLEASGETPEGKKKLSLERLEITAVSSGDMAETRVEHVFRNDSDAQLEGTFRFPMPEGAILTGLSLEINGALMDGELVERDKARKAYEETVDKMLDPALLEWESGQTFKLRVFPIEAHKTKRVVMRFLAPLHRTDAGLFFAYRPPTAESGLSPERVHVTLNGHAAGSSNATRTATGELLVKAEDGAPDVVVEKKKEGTYVHARVDLVPADAPRPPSVPQAMIVLCDRSRSMLEARALQAKTVGMILDDLGPSDRFQVVTGDVTIHPQEGGLQEPTAQAKAASVAFVDTVEPDGASDLGALFASAGVIAKRAADQGLLPVVVYLGDASPTWGATQPAELAAASKRAIGDAAVHVVLLGKSTETGIARELASVSHGRLLRPKTEDDARRAADKVVRAAASPRVDDVHLVGADGLDASPISSTLYEGDLAELSLFVPTEKTVGALSLVGTSGGKPWCKPIDLSHGATSKFVAERWATSKIEELELQGEGHEDEVVKTSLSFGVMSRYTSFLVLENEEAYARMNIARKAKQDSEARVSGRDLESVDGRTASVTPDHLQPGDPEVRIPAPADAQSVVVVFPFGETKTATFEPDDHGGAWIVRFLVDRHTPDGSYDIVVRVTHHNGDVEILKVPYVVDTKAPKLDVVITRRGRAYDIVATQVLTPEEIEAQAPSGLASLGQVAKMTRVASVLTDAKRVEVRAPDGEQIVLVHTSLGRFAGTWRPSTAPAPGSTLRVVAVDRALNETATEAPLP